MTGGVALAAGLGCALFGWTAPAAWAATPRDLMMALAARAAVLAPATPAPLRRHEFDALKARLDHS